MQQDIDEAKSLAALVPDYVAVEPPELIGGDVSVTSADPQIVSDTASAVREASEEVQGPMWRRNQVRARRFEGHRVSASAEFYLPVA